MLSSNKAEIDNQLIIQFEFYFTTNQNY